MFSLIHYCIKKPADLPFEYETKVCVSCIGIPEITFLVLGILSALRVGGLASVSSGGATTFLTFGVLFGLIDMLVAYSSIAKEFEYKASD